MTTKIILVAAAILNLCLVSCNSRSDETTESKENETANYHQLAIIRITDPVKFQQYIEVMAPIVVKYGGTLDRSFVPLEIEPESMEIPTVVNLVHYASKEAFLNFKNDPEFQSIVHLREESTEILSYEGYLLLEDKQSENETARMYNIEILSFKDQSGLLYHDYIKKMDPLFKDSNHHVEFTMRPETHSEGSFKPDLIKISYFEDAESKQNYEEKTANGMDNGEWYLNAVKESITISGKIRM